MKEANLDLTPDHSLNSMANALERLGEVLLRDAAADPVLLDATIQRFEFCFEINWKAIKKALFALEGFDATSPRQTFQKAFAVGWITDEALWIDMLNARNLTSHTYREELAWDIYHRIQLYYPEFQRLHRLLVEKTLQSQQAPPSRK